MKNLTLAAGAQVKLSAPQRPPTPPRRAVMVKTFANTPEIAGVYALELYVPGQTARPARVLCCLFQDGVNRDAAEAALERLGDTLGTALQVGGDLSLISVLHGEPLWEPVTEVGFRVYPPDEGAEPVGVFDDRANQSVVSDDGAAPDFVPESDAGAEPAANGDKSAAGAPADRRPWWKVWGN